MESNDFSCDFPTSANNTAVFGVIDSLTVFFIICTPKKALPWAITTNHQNQFSRSTCESAQEKSREWKKKMDCGLKRYSNVINSLMCRKLPMNRLLSNFAHILIRMGQ